MWELSLKHWISALGRGGPPCWESWWIVLIPPVLWPSLVLVVGARENETGKERKLLQGYVIKLLTIVGWWAKNCQDLLGNCTECTWDGEHLPTGKITPRGIHVLMCPRYICVNARHMHAQVWVQDNPSRRFCRCTSTPAAFPLWNQIPLRVLYFLFTKAEPILTHHNHPKSIVYLKVHSGYCTFFGFVQTYNNILFGCTLYFHCPQNDGSWYSAYMWEKCWSTVFVNYFGKHSNQVWAISQNFRCNEDGFI